MNVLILGDKYDKGMKSKGSQGLLRLNKQYNFIEHQNKVITNSIENSNILYVYGLWDKKLSSYVENNKSLKDIKLIYNPLYDQKNDTYSVFLCYESIVEDEGILILFGNTNLSKVRLNKLNKSSSCLWSCGNLDHSSIGCVYQNNKIHNIGFDLDTQIHNIYYIHRNDTKVFLSLISQTKNHNKFIFEIFNLMIDSNIGLQLL